MKVCFLASANSIHTIKWVNAFVGLGHDVYLISMHRPQRSLISDQVKVYELTIKTGFGYFLNIFELRKLIKVIKPDIISSHYASGYGTLNQLLNYRPNTLSVWGSDVYSFPMQNSMNRILLSWNLRSATQILSTSHAMKEQTLKFIKPSREILVTPFGTDTSIFQKKRSANSNRIVIGLIKKFEPVYGIEHLLNAFSILLVRLKKDDAHYGLVDRIELLIVGGGSLLEHYLHLCRELKIEDKVFFVGEIPHTVVPDYLNKMDIFCVPSIEESFGVAAIEAAACELPVIATRVGGLPEVVDDGKSGYLVEKENPVEIADRLYSLVIDPFLRLEMGKNGREFVLRNYDWNNNVRLMEKILLGLVNKEDNENEYSNA